MLDKIKKALGSKKDDKDNSGSAQGDLGMGPALSANPSANPSDNPTDSPTLTSDPISSASTATDQGTDPTVLPPAGTGQAPADPAGVSGMDPTQQGAALGGAQASTSQTEDLGSAKPVSPPAISPEEEQKLGGVAGVPTGAGSSSDDSSLPVRDVLDAKTSEPTTSGTVSQSTAPSSDLGVIPDTSGDAASGLASPQGDKTGGLTETNDETQSSTIPPVGETASPSGASSQPTTTTNDTVASNAPGATLPTQGEGGVPGSGADEELKKTHEPVIVLPDRLEMGQNVNAKVKVGMIPHVMEETHFIQSIELFSNDQSIGKVDLNPKDNKLPEADFQVSLMAGMKLKAVIYCNMHGKWEEDHLIGGESVAV